MVTPSTQASDSAVWLVSGANRGIGLGLVHQLSQRPNTIVFGGARDPKSATELQALAASSKNVHVVQLASADEQGNKAAADYIRTTTGRLDVVIANAGIGEVGATAATVSMEVMRRHFEINTLGPLILFQAMWPLMQSSPKPIFTVIGTMIGSITLQEKYPWPAIAPGTSKAAAHYIVGKIHSEHPNIIAFPLHPGK